uniref:Uncharacterized protein n=1 Tax=Rhizophora mucronata TaxID=61149 RepID=A0A2P2PLC4_RHIMU
MACSQVCYSLMSIFQSLNFLSLILNICCIPNINSKAGIFLSIIFPLSFIFNHVVSSYKLRKTNINPDCVFGQLDTK